MSRPVSCASSSALLQLFALLVCAFAFFSDFFWLGWGLGGRRQRRAQALSEVSPPATSVVTVNAEPAAVVECSATHGTEFLGQCLCHPGFIGAACDTRSRIPNPVWLDAKDHCPNLARDVTYNKSDDDGHLYFACYYTTSAGIVQIPNRIWREALRQEMKVWAKSRASDDRASEHERGFAHFAVLKTHAFGRVLEIGCGPYTQLKTAVASAFSGSPPGLQDIVLLEPNGKNYMRQVAHCSYRNGTLLGKPVTLLAIGAEDLDIEGMDTVISINVIDHVQDALAMLRNTHRALKTGGVLIWHDRWFDTPFGCRDQVQNFEVTLHPMRPRFALIEHFLTHFEPLYMNVRPEHTPKGRQCDGGNVYFIGKKKG